MMSNERPIAVHFGAGNIGRGFIGAVLQDAGYFVVFADVNPGLIRSLNDSGSYSLTELGAASTTKTYTHYRALHSVEQRSELIGQLSKAEIITASVGANILPLIAPVIAEGLAARTLSTPAVVMACENAINATDILKSEIRGVPELDQVAQFANTAVDRIVPIQPEGSEPNVSVEAFCEWVIDTSNLSDVNLEIPSATLVDRLEPFIERKLFTVNTAHLSAAYLGQQAGHATVVLALNDPAVMKKTKAVLEETSAVLLRKHNFDPAAHNRYVKKTMKRITSPAIDDEVERVGRDPIRKLSRLERLIGPAAQHAEHFGKPEHLLGVISAALAFENDDDPEVARLQLLLTSLSSSEFALEVCGISSSHPLSEFLVETIDNHKRQVARQGLLG